MSNPDAQSVRVMVSLSKREAEALQQLAETQRRTKSATVGVLVLAAWESEKARGRFK
jgi:predicted transcriptional regulator